MNRMVFLLLIFTAFMGSTSASVGQTESMDGKGIAKSGSQVHQGRGIIARLDLEAGKINIDHHPVPSLGLPAMSTDFKTQNRAVLSPLKPGQEVRFTFEEGADGQYVITRITPLE